MAVISRQVTVDFLVDESTGIGKYGELYVRFQPDGMYAPVTVCDAATAYIDAQAKVPAEFGEVAECINKRIAALQALL